MKGILIGLVGLLIAVEAYGAPASIPGEVSCDKGVDMARVQALVKRTAAALKKDQSKVLQEINRGDKQWKDGDLYVAVFQGTTVLAHGYFPSVVGQDVGGSRYLNTFPFVTSGRRIAMEKGEGCMQYRLNNPAKGGKVEEKVGFSSKVNDTIWLISGTYLTR